MTENIKHPPFSVEAECAVIGSLVLDPDLSLARWDEISEIVDANDFYRQDHQLFVAAISQLCEKNVKPDAVTVIELMENLGTLAETKGLPYLVELAEATPKSSNYKAYADIVRQRSLRRQLISACHDIADKAYSVEDKDVSEILDEAEAKIYAINDESVKAKSGPVFVDSIVDDVVTDIEKRRAGVKVGLQTGITGFDKITGGLKGGQLVVLAGPPSSGKTAFTGNVMDDVTIRQTKPALFFTMEMMASEVTERSIAGLSGVGLSGDIRHITTAQMQKIKSAADRIGSSPLLIDETPNLSVSQIRSRCRRALREHQIELVAIDYLGLMKITAGMSRNDGVGEITRNLKGLAKELNLPILLLSQMNRSYAARPDKRPVMSDLRDSGNIEADADIVGFVYRPEMYEEGNHLAGLAELIIRKQRGGPVGAVKMMFDGQFTKYTTLADDYYQKLYSGADNDKYADKYAGAYD